MSHFHVRPAMAFLVVGILVCSACGVGRVSDRSNVGTSAGADGTSAGADGNANDPATFSPAPATVRVHYPVGNRKLELTAPEPRALNDIGSDTWEYTTGVISSPLAFTPTLDGTPARGPSYKVNPGQTLDIYPHFFATKGKVRREWKAFKSTVHPTPQPEGRPIDVYFPPGYEENTVARYPVIYMFDAQIVFGDQSLSADQPIISMLLGDMLVDEALDAGAESGTIAETIVVGIPAPTSWPPKVQSDRLQEMTPTSAVDPTGNTDVSGDGPEFLQMIATELKAAVDSKFRTLTDKANTFIGGASAGGLMSVYAGFQSGDVFGGVIGFSSAVWWDSDWTVKRVAEKKFGSGVTSKVYVDVGDAETDPSDPTMPDIVVSNRALFQAYTTAGYVEGSTLKTFVEPGGEHTGQFWQKRVPVAFAFVIGKGPGR